jgi:hypothetical protein
MLPPFKNMKDLSNSVFSVWSMKGKERIRCFMRVHVVIEGWSYFTTPADVGITSSVSTIEIQDLSVLNISMYFSRV